MEYMEYQKSMVLATKYRAGKRSLFTPKTLILMMREYDEGVLGNERQ
jgi:hypothetical protein